MKKISFAFVFIILLLILLGLITYHLLNLAVIFSWPSLHAAPTQDPYQPNIFHLKPRFKLNAFKEIVTQYDYDKNARLIRKHHWGTLADYQYHYNHANQIREKTSVDGTVIKLYDYNTHQQLTRTTNLLHQTETKYDYAQNLLKQKKIFFNLDTPDTYHTLYSYTYDHQQRRLNKIYHGRYPPTPDCLCHSIYQREVVANYDYNHHGQKITQSTNRGTAFTYYYEKVIQEVIPTAPKNHASGRKSFPSCF